MLSIPRRRALLGLTAVALLPLAACTTTVGGNGTRAVSDFPSSTVSATASASASASVSPGEQEAEDLVRRTRNTLLTTDVVLDATLQDDDSGDLHVSGRWGSEGVSVVLSFSVIRLQVVGVAGHVYVQGPAAFWKSLDLPAAAAVTSDQWVQVQDPSSDVAWPASFGDTGFVEGMVLPDSSLSLRLTSDTQTGGRHTEVVTDEDGWVYTFLDDPAVPRVTHAEHTGDATVDLSYPTDTVPVATPAAATVVTVDGF